MSTASKRRIVQIYGEIDLSALNEALRQLCEMIYAVEGRTGPSIMKDQVQIQALQRKTPLRLAASGRRGYGAMAFGGTENSSLFLAKGAYLNDAEAWVAEDNVAVILELNRDSSTPRMFRNTGLSPGQIFTPEGVGWVAIGGSDGTAQGALTVDIYTGIDNLQVGAGLVVSAVGSTATLTPSGVPQSAVTNLTTDLLAKQNRLWAVTPTKTSDYNVAATDDLVVCDPAAGSFSVWLPASPSTGQFVAVKRVAGNPNTVTVQGNGKNIDGAATYALSAAYTAIQMVYSGTEWLTGAVK